ncbi:unnamed protein product [Adineta ricciae]|nr:unnamed protein product [Adineta ricciae]
MNADYSFTDPTWKLPPITNPSSMHSVTYDASQLPPNQNTNDDASTWNNQPSNVRYNPPINQQEQGEYYSQPDPYSQPPPQPYQQPEQQFFQSGPPVSQHPPPQPQPYRQPEQQFFQPRPSVSRLPLQPHQQEQEKQFPQPGPPASHLPSPPYQQPEQQFFQPRPSVSRLPLQPHQQEQEKQFPQPGPPTSHLPSPPYQQPEQQFFQPGPPASHPFHQSYQQPEEHLMHNRFPPSRPQMGERPKPPGPPAPSQPPQFYQPARERFIEQNAPQPPPVPHPQFNQQSTNQHRNIVNHSDNFDFAHNTNTEYHMPRQQQQQRNHGLPNAEHNNQGGNFPPLPQPAPRRLQNADHNHQSFFTDLAPNQENDHSLEMHNFEQKTKSHSRSTNDDMFDSIQSTNHRSNKMNIHEYLYGLSVADSGSYVKTFKNQRRLLSDERNNHRGVMNEYKSFLQNGGFGPQFGKVNQQTLQEKMEIENKKKLYSKQVRAINQQKIEDQMRLKNSGEQLRNRTYAAPVIQHRRQHELTSHLLFTPEVKEFERKIKRDHDASCKCSLHSRPFHSSA